MKKLMFGLFFVILFLSIVSAGTPVQLLITQQPNPVYNLGNSMTIPITIKSLGEVSGNLEMNLICNGQQVTFYKNGVKLSTGEEKKENPVLILTKENIGSATGTCRIKAIIQDQYTLSNEFKISDKLELALKTEAREFNPEQEILFEGEVKKENGESVNGFIELNLMEGNSKQNYAETINNGVFQLRFILPKETKSGQYLANLNFYEKDSSGEKTNTGFFDFNIKINQIPTRLEIIIENEKVNPGENLRVKGILRDQTGEKIDSQIILTIKNERDKILEQKEIISDESLEFAISYNQMPANWSIFAVSNKITSDSKFSINEKKEVKIELINKTLLVTNVGNVVYNDDISVKIGENFETFFIILNVDESKKFVLSAPEGQYEINLVEEGDNELLGSVMLTGKSVNIKEYSSIEKLFSPLVWIFIVGICGFMAFIFFKKGYKRSFFGYITSFKNRKPSEVITSKPKNTRSTAILTVSLRGDKQDASVVAVKIKNLKEAEPIGGTKETIRSMIDSSKTKKALLYENGDFLFFILAPVITKTFRNEKNALELARELKNILEKHNKVFQPKIEFGISVSYGTIVAKPESGILKFMSLGTLMSEAKKIATSSDQEILLGKEMNNKIRLAGGVKTEKSNKGNLEAYSVKEMMNSEENQKFIGSFLKRLDNKK
jgi:hypothetical protein